MKILANRKIKFLFCSILSCILVFVLISTVLVNLDVRNTVYYIIFCSVCMGAAILLFCYGYFKEQHKIMENAISQITEYISGNKEVTIECNDEGELYRLFHEVNSLVAILNAHAENEKSAKKFLRNTISDISHQLKTPLAALNIYNGIIQGEAKELPTIQEFSQLSEQELDRIETLVQSLLKITKLDAGTIILEKSLENVSELAKNIKKHFGEGESRVEVLKGIDIEIEKGEFCVLLGPSGSGKSTLLNIIGGIDAADEGYISINGEKTADMNEKALTLYRRKHLGYIFQMYNLIPNLNIKENIEVGAYLSDNPLDVDDLLKTLGLYEHRHKLPNQLSGGQQQRTAIGRAIVKNPDILLCDEPTGALDYNTSKEILQLIEDVNKKYGNTIIMVTHNDAIKQMADRVVKLRDGMIRKNYLNETKLTAAELDW